MNKQVEEMAREICKRRFGHNEPLCETCDTRCLYIELSKIAYEADYRKSTDVVREIFAEIDKTAYGDMDFFKMLKKKYESEGKK